MSNGRVKRSSKSSSPKISVVMSSYNRSQYIRDAIESVLKQSYKNFEFIIIDRL